MLVAFPRVMGRIRSFTLVVAVLAVLEVLATRADARPLARPAPHQTFGVASLQGRRYEIKRWVVGTSPNRFRRDYLELRLQGGRGGWIFRDDVHAGVSRTQNELAYYHTSHDLGLNVVPRVVRGSWNGRSGTLQRLVNDAQRSSGALGQDARLVQANTRAGKPEVDWDSLHALAIQHYVTRMADDRPYNILVSKAADGRLRYSAIDGERALGRNGGFGRYHHARNLVQQSFGFGGPRQLSATLWERIRKADISRWKQNMETNGVPPVEIDQAVGRLRAVQEQGLSALFH